MRPALTRGCQAQQIIEKTLDHLLSVRGSLREGNGLIHLLQRSLRLDVWRVDGKKGNHESRGIIEKSAIVVQEAIMWLGLGWSPCSWLEVVRLEIF